MKKAIQFLILLIFVSSVYAKIEFWVVPAINADNFTAITIQGAKENGIDTGKLYIPKDPDTYANIGGGAGCRTELEPCYQDNDCCIGLFCINSTCQKEESILSFEKVKYPVIGFSSIIAISAFFIVVGKKRKKEEQEEAA